MVKISVIVPCYNVEEYLEECLDSIINQTLEDIEIICIDDGSTDNTPEILKSYANKDNRIKLILQPNSGLSASRNVGLDNSCGEYICFIDSDDYLELTALEETYKIATKKSLDFLIFKIINFDDETRKKQRVRYFDMPYLKRIVKNKVFHYKKISEIVFQLAVTATGKLYNHEFIKDMRFPEGLLFEDNVFYAQTMFSAKRMYFYDKYLYNRRVRSDSITQVSTPRYAEYIEIFNMVCDITAKITKNPFYIRKSYNFKIKNLFNNFHALNEEHKPGFFKKMKEDFINHKDEYYVDEEFQNLDDKAKFIFNCIFECEKYKEYELKVLNNNYMLNNDKLTNENSQLKQEVNKITRFNNDILNSTSWKITKPIRKITNMFRG
ncbi:glycosyltransferase family 2 protein [Methanobrevibacter sp.]|uniref:glycosyltransferase family 2 protein n=1 Tax=Methanobrevibacter sp. TaxID=66852 RepID=UPI00388F078B